RFDAPRRGAEPSDGQHFRPDESASHRTVRTGRLRCPPLSALLALQLPQALAMPAWSRLHARRNRRNGCPTNSENGSEPRRSARVAAFIEIDVIEHRL